MDPQKDCAQGRKRGEAAREVAGGPATSRGVFASGSEREGKDREPQGYAIHLKAVEKDWRMIFEEELANLELDLGVRSRRVEW